MGVSLEIHEVSHSIQLNFCMLVVVAGLSLIYCGFYKNYIRSMPAVLLMSLKPAPTTIPSKNLMRQPSEVCVCTVANLMKFET